MAEEAKEDKKYSAREVEGYLEAQRKLLIESLQLREDYEPNYQQRGILLEIIRAAKQIPQEFWNKGFLDPLNKLERILGREETIRR